METKEKWKTISWQTRKELGVGRGRFAKILGVSPQTVLRWEQGEALPGPKYRAKLAFLLNEMHPEGVPEQPINPEDKNRKEKKMSGWATVLIAQTLSSAARLLTKEIVAELVRQLLAALIRREKKTPHIHRDIGDPKGEVPPIWYVLRQYAKEEKFKEINEVGSALIEEGVAERWPSPERERFYDWVGVGAMRNGEAMRAISLFNDAIDGTDDPRIRVSAYSNLSWVYLHLNRPELARQAAEKALQIDSTYEAAIYNRLCIASEERREEDFVAYAEQLLQNHGEAANDPESHLGKALLSDSDLDYFRSALDSGRVFKKLFPGLTREDLAPELDLTQGSGRNVHTTVSRLSRTAAVLLIVGIIFFVAFRPTDASGAQSVGMSSTRQAVEKIL